MSREFEVGADLALQDRHVSQVVFLELDFLSGVSRVCTREHSVEWDSQTWLGAGRVGSIEPISEGVELEARGIAMTISALPSGLLATALTPSEYKGRNVKLWFGQMAEERYLSLPGTSGNYASTPDSAVVSVTGDIDIRVKVAAVDWTPATAYDFMGKLLSDSSEFSWIFRLNTGGTLNFYHTVDGSTLKSATSSVATGLIDGSTKWLRVTLDVNNGAAGHDVKFYTSDDGVVWVQLGTTQTTAGTTSIFDGTASLRVQDERSGVAGVMSGKFYYAELRNGIDGPVVAKFDASLLNPGQTSAQMPTGEVWTVNQSGTPNAHIVRDPLAVVADPVGPFIFKMDQLTFQLGGESAALRLTAESRLADWNRPRVRRYNNADHQALHPGDKFFEHVEKQIEAVHRW